MLGKLIESDTRWWQTILSMVALGTISLTARRVDAIPECLPQGGTGTVYLCDPLVNNANPTTTVVGGTFVTDGWRIDAFHDLLLFDLGEPMISGTVRFYVRGVSGTSLGQPGTGSADHRHLMEFWDDGGHQGDSAYAMQLRTWGNSVDNVPDWWGHLRFSAKSWGEAMVSDCGQELYFQHQVIPGNWLGGWVRVEITFGNGQSHISLLEEGTSLEWSSIANYSNCAPGTPVFRYLYFPWHSVWGLRSVIDSVAGSVYASVSFVGIPATCHDPCDDDNPCTEGQYGDALFTHYCEAGQCAADPVPNDTPCGVDGTCQDGVCIETQEPDAGVSPDSMVIDAFVLVDSETLSDANAIEDASVDVSVSKGDISGGCKCRKTSQPGGTVTLIFLLLAVMGIGRRFRTRQTGLL